MRGHVHDRSESRALGLALVLVLGFAGVELVAAFLAGSLALLADAGHMVSDAVALGLALVATWLARRPATPERTFGWRRAEILAALANALVLVALGLWIVVEAVGRIGDAPSVEGGWVLAAGLAGLAVNVGGRARAARRRRRAERPGRVPARARRPRLLGRRGASRRS